jgi:REP element-mobilizing transposase RayT
MENKKIRDMVAKLKKNRDKKFHCLLYLMVWDFKENIPGEHWQDLFDVFELCAQKSKWPLHKCRICTNHILLVVQGHPDVSAEKIFSTFHKSLARCLSKKIPEVKTKESWVPDTTILSIDQSDLKKML